MSKVIVQPVLNFYKFYNVPLAKQIREEIELKGGQWRRNPAMDNIAFHSDLDHEILPSMTVLKSWFQSCLDEVVAADLPEGYGCSVTEMWMTRTQQGQAMHTHVHPLSVYSGVYYLQDSAGSTDFMLSTWFHERWPQMVLPHAIKPTQREWSSPCRQGHLIIFPSHIFHRQQPLSQDETRYTVAFNSFWSGQLCNHHTARLWVQSQEQAPQ